LIIIINNGIIILITDGCTLTDALGGRGLAVGVGGGCGTFAIGAFCLVSNAGFRPEFAGTTVVDPYWVTEPAFPAHPELVNHGVF
jgi:hypothetical protein